MQALANAKEGTHTVQWMFGIPEIPEQLREWNIFEGKQIRVIATYRNAVLAGAAPFPRKCGRKKVSYQERN